MTDHEINAIAYQSASKVLQAMHDLNADGADVILAVEFFAAYLIGTIVLPGHDREAVETLNDGIALRLVEFRKRAAEMRH